MLPTRWCSSISPCSIFTIAVGFVLRVWAGAVALDVPVSGWMFVTTLSLALYLAAVKRGQELATSGVQGRKVLERYSKPLVDRYAEMSATCALVFYSMFIDVRQTATRHYRSGRIVRAFPLLVRGRNARRRRIPDGRAV